MIKSRKVCEFGMTEFVITCESELQKDGSYKIKRYRELVRCKDCNNRGTSDCPIEELCNGWIPSDDWFCADGKRK